MKSKRFWGLALSLAALAAPLCAGPVLSGLVVDASRRPVAGATVQVIADRPHYLLPDDIAPCAETRTGADGRFSLDLPDTGTVALLARAPGLRLTRFPLDRTALPTRPIGLRLAPAAAISGTVIAADGTPLSGVRIGPLLPAPNVEREAARRFLPQWTTSAPDGSFSFDGLPPDTSCSFLVQAPGLQAARIETRAGTTSLRVPMKRGGSSLDVQLASQASPSGADWRATPIRVNGGGFDFVAPAGPAGEGSFAGIPPGEYTVEAVLPPPQFGTVPTVTMPADSGTTVQIEISAGYTISGTAVDIDTSSPAAGVALEVNDQLTTTDQLGRFTTGRLWLTGVPTVEVVRESGFRAADEVESPETFPPADGFHDLTGLTIPVVRARVLECRVPDLEKTTRTVTLHLLSGDVPEQRFRITTSPMEIRVYQPGHYAAWVSDQGDLASELAPLDLSKSSRLSHTFRLAPGALLSGQVVRIAEPGTTPSATRATVRLWSGDESTSLVMIAETEVSAEGRFSFPLLPTGPGYGEAQLASRRQLSSLRLVPGSNPDLTFRFTAGRSLSGLVTDSEGRPVPGAAVRLTFPAGSAGTGSSDALETDARGGFSAEEIDAESIEILEVRQVGFTPVRLRQIALPATDLRITLPDAPRLHVRIDSPPSSFWNVYLLRSEEGSGAGFRGQLASRESGSEVTTGGATLPLSLPGAGRYFVAAAGVGGELAVSDPVTWDGESRELPSVVLQPGVTGRLEGTLSGAPTGETVRIVATNMTIPERARTEYETTAVDDRFSFPALPPGDYLLLATTPTFAAHASNVTIRPNGTTRAHLTPAAAP